MPVMPRKSHLNIGIRMHHKTWKGIPKAALKPIILESCNAAYMHEKPENKADITVVLVNDEEISTLNRNYRGKDKPTNVLSFPDGETPMPGAPIYLGDIVLALDTVQHEADEQHKKFEHHLSHMLVHATLHLLGYDHEQENQAEEMEALEIEILKSLSIANPYL